MSKLDLTMLRTDNHMKKIKGYYFLLRSLSLGFRLCLCLSRWRRFSTLDDLSWFRGAFVSWFATRRFNIALKQQAKSKPATCTYLHWELVRKRESRSEVQKLSVNRDS